MLACLSLYRAFGHDVARMPEYIQVIAAESPGLVVTPDSETAGGGALDETIPARIRREVRGLRGLSTSLGGFEPDRRPGGDEGEAAIVSYRPLSSGGIGVRRSVSGYGDRPVSPVTRVSTPTPRPQRG